MKRWVPFAVWLVIVGTIIALANTGRLGFVLSWLKANPGSDKVAHFLLIGTLAFLLNHATRHRRFRGLIMGSLIVAVALTAEEFSQRFIPGRTFDFRDLFANLCGCALADILSRVRSRK